MEAYNELRLRARNKRDAAIREVRAEYRRELLAIQRLRDSIDGEPSRRRGPKRTVGLAKPKAIMALVRELMPKDRQFTIAQVRDILGEHEPDRRFYRATLRTTFANLKREGAVRRVRRIGKGQVLWEAVATEHAQTPFAAMLLPDAAEVVLREGGPLRTAELVVALQGRGYRPDAMPRVLQDTARAALKRCERFACGEDGRWGLRA